MSSPDPLETLRVEGSCSICLEFLQDPVLIDCGHNFCRRCIARWWAELTRDFPCPVCRKTSRRPSCRPNRQLGNMVEAARQLRGSKRTRREGNPCPAHGQALARFCRDDQAPVCLLCQVSHAHRAHLLVPIEEATREYKEKLRRCLELLEQKLESVSCCRAREEKKPRELKRKVAQQREGISQEFQELHRLLEEEEQELVRRLLLSPDRKSVRFSAAVSRDLPDSPRRFTLYPCVLASQGFTSGRHYWEVEVGNKTHWALGVCADSVSRKGESAPFPESGFWRVRLWNGDKYAATTTPFTPLTLRVKPKRVGIFLDYEAGKVAFYNVTDRSHIFTFSDTFSGKVWPLFYPGIRAGRRNAAPLVIRSPTDWE